MEHKSGGLPAGGVRLHTSLWLLRKNQDRERLLEFCAHAVGEKLQPTLFNTPDFPTF